MKTILITGASSGIGQATAELFLQAGWQVGLLARRRDALEQIAAHSPAAISIFFRRRARAFCTSVRRRLAASA